MTQEEFAREMKLSTVSIAKYETNFIPGRPILKRFAKLAERHRRTIEATIFREYGVTISDEALAIVASTEGALESESVFLAIIGALKGEQQLDRIDGDFRRLLEHYFHEPELSEIVAFAWLLSFPADRRRSRHFLVDNIYRIIEHGNPDITENDLRELGDLSREAQAFREVRRGLDELTLPIAITSFRKQLAMSRARLAAKLGITIELLKDFETGSAVPDHKVLHALTELAPVKHHKDSTIEFFSVEFLFLWRAAENATVDWLRRANKEAITPHAKLDLFRKLLTNPRLDPEDRNLVELMLATMEHSNANTARLQDILEENKSLKERLQLYEPFGPSVRLSQPTPTLDLDQAPSSTGGPWHH